jgi:hypothetical protein
LERVFDPLEDELADVAVFVADAVFVVGLEPLAVWAVGKSVPIDAM